MDAPTVHLPPFLCTLDFLWLSPSVRTSMRVRRVPMTKTASTRQSRKSDMQSVKRICVCWGMNVEPRRLVCAEIETFDVSKRGAM